MVARHLLGLLAWELELEVILRASFQPARLTASKLQQCSQGAKVKPQTGLCKAQSIIAPRCCHEAREKTRKRLKHLASPQWRRDANSSCLHRAQNRCSQCRAIPCALIALNLFYVCTHGMALHGEAFCGPRCTNGTRTDLGGSTRLWASIRMSFKNLGTTQV